PGVIPTEGYGKEMAWSDEYVEAYKQRVAKEIPSGRVGVPSDIGNAVIFLASDAGAYVNGVELAVDGGMTQIYQGKNGAE
ncbi:SDR family oxidoreductase, partial [Sphingobium sp. H39-3-25]|uniref:SDR family oxidoreductase n=1 Tax=Sphingobium arseniciresistens TaxID=3030834 RepID=UPI0023BA3B32|nr:SDR family oxidoreductase [Sphingobium arseniciresistens]